MAKRVIGRCEGCGASVDLGGESLICGECTQQKYEEVFIHRVSFSPEFQAFKALLYGAIMLFICLPAFASPTVNLKAIAMIESSGNPGAIGDHGKALGLYQIHKEVIEDYNEDHGTHLKHHSCALEAGCANKVADWYLGVRIPEMLRAYGKKVTLENVLTAWNMGIGRVRQGKVAKKYIRAYEEAL